MLLQGADVRAGGGMAEAGDDVAYRGRVGDQGPERALSHSRRDFSRPDSVRG
jgi:hypothetical protein